MKTNKWHFKYLKWYSVDEMHESAKNWMSDLSFIKDEQHFFENILLQFAQNFTNSKEISVIKTILKNLDKLKKERKTLTWMLSQHMNNLDLLADGINEMKEEKIYKETYKAVLEGINEFQVKHKNLKKLLFEELSKNLKVGKENAVFLFKS